MHVKQSYLQFVKNRSWRYLKTTLPTTVATNLTETVTVLVHMLPQATVFRVRLAEKTNEKPY